MAQWLLTLGDSGGRHAAALAALTDAGGVPAGVLLASDPSRGELDRALAAADGRRIVVQSTAADLARVLRRMMRRDDLASAETAVLPFEPVPFLAGQGVPVALAAAASVAVRGICRTVGVLKDDSGNLVVDHARLLPWTGSLVWTRAYVDDDCLSDGPIRSLEVRRGVSGGLVASVRGRFGRLRTLAGRGLALSCDEAAISSDDSERTQPRRKRIWWDEPEQWRLALPG